MYLTLGETKIIVLAEAHDNNVLTLHIQPELDMTELYSLFTSSNLGTIILYNDNDSMIAAFSWYETIESFFYIPVETKYIINLSKYQVQDLQEDVKKCMEKCDKLNESFATIQNSDLSKQGEYALQTLASTFTDEQAVNCMLLFPTWNGNGNNYKKDERLQHKNKLYKVLQDHTSQADWIPGKSPSLYVEISDPSIEYPEWKQPTGAHDAYKGTREDPIPVPDSVTTSGFEYEYGKYYLDNGKIYLAKREGKKDGEIETLYFPPSALIGQYFVVVE